MKSQLKFHVIEHFDGLSDKDASVLHERAIRGYRPSFCGELKNTLNEAFQDFVDWMLPLAIEDLQSSSNLINNTPGAHYGYYSYILLRASSRDKFIIERDLNGLDEWDDGVSHDESDDDGERFDDMMFNTEADAIQAFSEWLIERVQSDIDKHSEVEYNDVFYSVNEVIVSNNSTQEMLPDVPEFIAETPRDNKVELLTVGQDNNYMVLVHDEPLGYLRLTNNGWSLFYEETMRTMGNWKTRKDAIAQIQKDTDDGLFEHN